MALLLGQGCGVERFENWSHSLESALRECGYVGAPGFAGVVARLDEWKGRFCGWVREPVLNDINAARPLFDLHPVHGNNRLWAELQDYVRHEIRAEKSFVRILAHDCLANLPPLTIFRDLVVEGTGAHTSVFQLERKALRPLVDAGRVVGIAAGCVPGQSSSLARFAMARVMWPGHEAVFREAADTLRVVLYHQARAGIRGHSDGFELPPSLLSGHDRQVLKSGFRSILRLLEFTAECRWLETP
jgi:CBS domain-containing protein